MLAQNKEGHGLVRQLPLSEAQLSLASGLTHARVVAHREGKVLLVFDRHKRRWQLPGGAIEPHESARECARRELDEESSNTGSVRDFRFLCGFELEVVPTALNPEPHSELGALYAIDIDHVAAFIPNDEIGATLWWGGSTLSHELDAIDRKLIELSKQRVERVA